MHLLLTDRLACPRCGPDFGLILRADRMSDRTVYDGVLGCPNCRGSYPIRDGLADLRPLPHGEPPAEGPRAPPPQEGECDRLHALLGVVRGPGTILLGGDVRPCVSELADRIPDIDWVVLGSRPAGKDDLAGVSWIRASTPFPFFSRSLRGMVLGGVSKRSVLSESARVLAPGGRVVFTGAPTDAASVLQAEGLTLLAEEGGTVVAARG